MLLSQALIRSRSSPWNRTSRLLLSRQLEQTRWFAEKPEVKVTHVPEKSGSGKLPFLVVGTLGLGAVAYTQQDLIKEKLGMTPAPATAPMKAPEKPVKAAVEKKPPVEKLLAADAAPAEVVKPPEPEKDRIVKALKEAASTEAVAPSETQQEKADPEKARILKALGELGGSEPSQQLLREVIAAAVAAGIEGPLLDGAVLKLTQLEEAEKKLAAQNMARTALKEALAGEFTENLRAAIQAATGVLDSSEEILESAASKLSFLEKRESCLKELRAAASSSDPQRCKAALEEGAKLGLESFAEYQLAEVAFEPRRLCDQLAKDDSVLFAKEAKSSYTVDDFTAAEKEAVQGLSQEELRERLLERTRALALSRLYHNMRMEEALTTFRESVDAGYKAKLEKALNTLEDSLEKKAQADREALEASLQEHHRQVLQETVAKAEIDAANEGEAKMTEIRRQAMEELESERDSHLHAVRNLRGMLEATENALSKEDNVKRRAHANTQLSAALLGLESALQAGRCPANEFEHLKKVAAEADAFSAALLQQLPETCIELTKKRIPTEPRLQSSFQDTLDELVAAAFVPQNSGLFGQLVGRLFKTFYVLERDPEAMPHVTPDQDKPTDVQQNLAALSRAAYQVDQGELLKAIAIIEASLVGNCRGCAVSWLTEAKAAMTLRQVITAVKAQAQCLNYSLI